MHNHNYFRLHTRLFFVFTAWKQLTSWTCVMGVWKFFECFILSLYVGLGNFQSSFFFLDPRCTMCLRHHTVETLLESLPKYVHGHLNDVLKQEFWGSTISFGQKHHLKAMLLLQLHWKQVLTAIRAAARRLFSHFCVIVKKRGLGLINLRTT